MKTIVVASGKGGAGKTSFTASFMAWLHGQGIRAVAADADVDAANLGLALKAGEPSERSTYIAGDAWEVRAEACTGCGACAAACRFDAISLASGAARIDPFSCERCGACADVCPTGAIKSVPAVAGELLRSPIAYGEALAHGELIPGEDASGKLVRQVRESAARIAGHEGLVVVDAPPGIGCPAMAAISGAGLLVVLVEAGASGIRDAARLLDNAAIAKVPAVAVLNKAGLSAERDSEARNLAAERGLDVLGRIPFDPAFRLAAERGGTWLDSGAPGPVEAVREACAAVAARAGLIPTTSPAGDAPERTAP
ncbi:MAG: 4Fe-4S binding protein [Spirochaetales bacterium]|nr:4Fe-4S binding protein [Spirochaetales bacterium]